MNFTEKVVCTYVSVICQAVMLIRLKLKSIFQVINVDDVVAQDKVINQI